MSSADIAKAALIKSAVQPPEFGYEVHFVEKTRNHVMAMGVFKDKYFIIYISRFMDFLVPELYLTFCSGVQGEDFPVTDIGVCRQFMGAEVQSANDYLFIGQYCYEAHAGTFFAIKVFHANADYTCDYVNTIFMDGQSVRSNNLTGKFHCTDTECTQLIVFWGDMTNNEYFSVSESTQSPRNPSVAIYVTSCEKWDRGEIPVDFHDLNDVHFISSNTVYWAEVRPIDVELHPTLVFVRIASFDRAVGRARCTFLLVVDVGFSLSRCEDTDLAYIQDIKTSAAGDTYFLVRATFGKQLDVLNQKKCHAYFLLSVSGATGKEEILDSYIQEDSAFVWCAMDVCNKRMVWFVM